MEDYRPNSHTYKEGQKKEPVSEKKVRKVVTGKTKTKKKSEVNKLADVFISEDVSNVKSYILMDVLIPAAKKAISDIVTNGIDMILYGEPRRGSKSSSSHYISYSSISKEPRERDRGNHTRTGFDYDDIFFDYRPDAEMVLDQMNDIIDHYGFVTVADFFDMADRTAPYTAQKYGWTSVRSAEIIRTRDGYKIKLPKAYVID